MSEATIQAGSITERAAEQARLNKSLVQMRDIKKRLADGYGKGLNIAGDGCRGYLRQVFIPEFAREDVVNFVEAAIEFQIAEGLAWFKENGIEP